MYVMGIHGVCGDRCFRLIRSKELAITLDNHLSLLKEGDFSPQGRKDSLWLFSS